MSELVSVVITSYGREFAQIRRSIESAHKQTYQDIEIILVDDNDPNSDCRKDIEETVSSLDYVRYCPMEKNSGAQKARNKGISVSRGSFIAFLDDDDEWLPQKIEKQMSVYQKGVGLIYSKGYSIDEATGNKKPYVTSFNFRKEVGFLDLLYADYIGTTTQALIPKEVFDKCGRFDILQPARQDYEMWLRISREYRCIGVDEPLFYHYYHEGEQISKNPKKAICGLKHILDVNADAYKKHPIAKSHVYLNMYRHVKKNDIRQAVKFAILASLFFVKGCFSDHSYIRRIMNNK